MLPRGWVALAIVAALATSARAQVASDELGIERFRLAMDRAGVLDVEWAGVPGHLSWGAGVLVGFAHAPLVLYDRDMNAVDPVVERRLTTTLSGSIALWNRLELGVAVDLIGYQSGTELTPAMADVPGSGMGDLRLVAKVLALGSDRLQLSFVPALIVPGGSARGYLREAGPAFSPAVALSARAGRIRGAVNAGYQLKTRVETAGLVSDDEAFARIGAAFALGAVRSPLVELWWSTSFASPLTDADKNQIALEMFGGASRQITPSVGAFAAFGVGLDNGFGTPDWRALAGVRFEVASADRDGDHVVGSADRCPDDPEDVDGWDDTDGCPDLDNDGDGVADDRDRCAAAAEDNDGFEDEDGCVDADNDADGITDADDRCPAAAEDKDGFQDGDGCADGMSRVAGRVVDPDGRPIGGASVSIVQTEKVDAAALELTADADGRFATDLDGGALQITARAKEYKDGASEATVAPGTTGEITVTLVRAVRQGQLRGQVLSFDGRPLAATITVKGKTTASVATDEGGMFSVDLPDGAFTVEIKSPGFATQKRSVSIKRDGVTVLNVDLRSAK